MHEISTCSVVTATKSYSIGIYDDDNANNKIIIVPYLGSKFA